MKIDRSEDYRGGYAIGYEDGKRRAGENIQNADLRVAEEREHFATLLLNTAQRWMIYAAANQEHPEKVAAGEAVDQVCRAMAAMVRKGAHLYEGIPGTLSEPLDIVDSHGRVEP